MYERPGRAFYTVATKAVNAHEPITENGIVGAAIKTTARPWSAGYDPLTNTLIAVGEKVTIRTKGIHQFDTSAGRPAVGIAAATKGAAVYIRPADNTLQIEPGAVSTDLPFGRVVEISGDSRGVGVNKIRIDLDQKDTIVAAT